MSYRVIVCGGRNYDDQARVDAVLDGLFAKCGGGMTLMHGSACGADACANAWGMAKRAFGASVGIHRWSADWRKLGPAAGPARNQRMLAEGRPHLVVAFPGGRGTADMVRRATAAGVPVLHVPAAAAPTEARSA